MCGRRSENRTLGFDGSTDTLFVFSMYFVSCFFGSFSFEVFNGASLCELVLVSKN